MKQLLGTDLAQTHVLDVPPDAYDYIDWEAVEIAYDDDETYPREEAA